MTTGRINQVTTVPPALGRDPLVGRRRLPFEGRSFVDPIRSKRRQALKGYASGATLPTVLPRSPSTRPTLFPRSHKPQDGFPSSPERRRWHPTVRTTDHGRHARASHRRGGSPISYQLPVWPQAIHPRPSRIANALA
jgi:hypothetical protein